MKKIDINAESNLDLILKKVDDQEATFQIDKTNIIVKARRPDVIAGAKKAVQKNKEIAKAVTKKMKKEGIKNLRSDFKSIMENLGDLVSETSRISTESISDMKSTTNFLILDEPLKEYESSGVLNLVSSSAPKIYINGRDRILYSNDKKHQKTHIIVLVPEKYPRIIWELFPERPHRFKINSEGDIIWEWHYRKESPLNGNVAKPKKIPPLQLQLRLDLKGKEYKEICKSLKLPVSGTRNKLKVRIEEHLKKNPNDFKKIDKEYFKK